MNKYYILTPAQMEKLTKEQQGGGSFSPDLSLSRLPQLANLEANITKHLNKKNKNKDDPYTHYMQYKQMQNDLNRIYSWLQAKENAQSSPATPSRDVKPLIDFVSPPPTFKPKNIMDEVVPPLTNKKRRSGIPKLIKRPALYRSRSNLELGTRKRPLPTPSKSTPPTSPQVSPRRSRSKGGPLRWASIDEARKQYPKIGRI